MKASTRISSSRPARAARSPGARAARGCARSADSSSCWRVGADHAAAARQPQRLDHARKAHRRRRRARVGRRERVHEEARRRAGRRRPGRARDWRLSRWRARRRRYASGARAPRRPAPRVTTGRSPTAITPSIGLRPRAVERSPRPTPRSWNRTGTRGPATDRRADGSDRSRTPARRRARAAASPNDAQLVAGRVGEEQDLAVNVDVQCSVNVDVDCITIRATCSAVGSAQQYQGSFRYGTASRVARGARDGTGSPDVRVQVRGDRRRTSPRAARSGARRPAPRGRAAARRRAGRDGARRGSATSDRSADPRPHVARARAAASPRESAAGSRTGSATT